MLKVLQKRIEAKVETTHFLTDDQFGFRRGRGTRDAIATLRTLAERSLEFGQSVYVCFVDYEKAFDRVDWKKLMSILRKLGVDYRDRRLIGNLYMGQSFKVRVDGEDSTPGIIGRGTRQGCPLSPLLFNIYIQELLNEALEGNNDGIKVGGHLVQAIRFADDQAMVANTVKALQRLMDALDKTSEEFGMRINIKKTKVMVISKRDTCITRNWNRLQSSATWVA
jgi:retron-type reverse transcriptase